MTFMDEVHHDSEISARNGARQLQLWLLTIAPVRTEDGMSLILDGIELLAEDMGWPMKHDETLGRSVLE